MHEMYKGLFLRVRLILLDAQYLNITHRYMCNEWNRLISSVVYDMLTLMEMLLVSCPLFFYEVVCLLFILSLIRLQNVMFIVLSGSILHFTFSFNDHSSSMQNLKSDEYSQYQILCDLNVRLIEKKPSLLLCIIHYLLYKMFSRYWRRDIDCRIMDLSN